MSKSVIRSTTHLARHLGLSRWTISRALNNHPGIHPKTADRVRRAIQALRFEPDPLARALRGGRTVTIGIAIQELENLNLTSKISDLQQRLRQQQYRGLIEFTMGQPEMEEQVIRHFIATRVEGVVLVASSQASRSSGLQLLRKNRIATVLIDPLEENLAGSISVDRRHAMQLVMDHLYELGHRQFAALGVAPDMPYGAVRLDGLRAAFRRHGWPWKQHLTLFSEKKPERLDSAYGWRLAAQFIQSRCPASALIALNDRLAFGAMRCLQQKGYHLPRDISLVGYDNMDLAAFCSPPLTTIDAQVDHLIDQAVEMLFTQIRGRTRPCGMPAQVTPLLVTRASTAPPSPKRNRRLP